MGFNRIKKKLTVGDMATATNEALVSAKRKRDEKFDR
jgi:hypothetical protein